MSVKLQASSSSKYQNWFLSVLNLEFNNNNNNNNNLLLLLTAIWLIPGGSGYFPCIQNMTPVTTKLKSGGLHEKHVVATWKVGNHLSICF
jgi:hypothetical protein